MNKKFLTAIATLAMAATVGAGVAAMSGCSADGDYEGEYHYTANFGTGDIEYGIKVKVSVEGTKITNVEVVDSDYVSVSDGWASKDTWNNGLDGLLAKYKGKEITDILATTVRVTQASEASAYTPAGQPNSVSDSSLVITGATQGSGRLALAVQDAVLATAKKLGYKVYEGEYEYANPYSAAAAHYGIKVRVIVNKGEILKVGIIDSEYVELTSSWTDEGKALWNNGIAGLLNKYEGKNVKDIKAVTVETEENGTPKSVSDSNLMITGATQGSGRLLLAVQNALNSKAL